MRLEEALKYAVSSQQSWQPIVDSAVNTIDLLGNNGPADAVWGVLSDRLRDGADSREPLLNKIGQHLITYSGLHALDPDHTGFEVEHPEGGDLNVRSVNTQAGKQLYAGLFFGGSGKPQRGLVRFAPVAPEELHNVLKEYPEGLDKQHAYEFLKSNFNYTPPSEPK